METDGTTQTPGGALEKAPKPTKKEQELTRVEAANQVGAIVLQRNANLLSIVKDEEPSKALQATREYKLDLSKEVDGMEAPDGVRQVIQWYTVLENSTDGIDLLKMLERQDLMDMTNPLIVIGTILYLSKEKMNKTQKNIVLNEILETLNEDQIADLLLSIDSLEGLNSQEKSELKEAFARLLVNQATNLSDSYENLSVEGVSDWDFGRRARNDYYEPDEIHADRFELEEEELYDTDPNFMGISVVDRDYTELLGTGDTDDELVKVLTAINKAGETQLEADLLLELAENNAKADMLNRKYHTDKVGGWVKSVDKFAQLISKLMTERLPQTRKDIINALERITEAAEAEQRKMLSAGTTGEGEEVTKPEAAENEVGDETNL